MIRRIGLGRWFLALCLLVGVCALGPVQARADCPLYRLPTNRFGVTLNPSFGRIADYDVGALHISWYSDWQTSLNPIRPGGMDYAQLIWVQAGVPALSLNELGARVDANPGSLWMIGNEPECVVPPGGGNNTPTQYVNAYHPLYTFIKGRDPTALVAIGGVVQPTPLRLKWLDQVLQQYQATYGVPMPVDVWNIHNLILQEKRNSWGCGIPAGLSENEGRLYTRDQHDDMDIFKQHIVDFRTWMRDRGFRDKPLVITEYGILFPEELGYTVPRVNAFMTASFDYLLSKTDANLGYPADGNLLVQRWLWCSLNDRPVTWDDELGTWVGNFNGGLFDWMDNTFPGTMTPFGVNYASYTSALLTGTACISGSVHLEARPALPHASYVTTATVTLLPVDCPQPDFRQVTTDQAGQFTLCGIPAGTYDILVKGYNTLAARTPGVVLGAGTTGVDLGTLRAGDANNDNYVTIADFTILAAAYAASAGDPAFDQRADFNNDGRVDIRDFSLLATHFSEIGDQ